MGRQSLRPFLGILLFGFTISLVPAMAQANDQPTPATSAYVYVGTCPGYCNNDSSESAVSGFAVAGNGSAQSIPGSPFPLASYELSANPNFLFAVNGIGSQDIFTYSPAQNGSLTQVAVVNALTGSCRRDAYVQLLSPEPSGQFLYAGVGNNFSCGTDYTAWSISATGQLSYVSSPDELQAYAWGGALTFSPNDRFAYTGTVAEYDGSLAGFIRDQQGSLIPFSPNPAAPQSPLSDYPVCDVGDSASSSAGYVTVLWYDGLYCYDGGQGITVIANYTVNSNGTLAVIPGSVVTPTVNLVNMLYDPSGQYLAMVGSLAYGRHSAGAIQIYKLQPGGGLSPAGPVEIVPGISNLINVAWDNADHLYTTGEANYSNCSGTCGLYIFNNNDGVLTPAPGSPHPVQNIVSLAVLPVQ
jgi:hypothetical protein